MRNSSFAAMSAAVEHSWAAELSTAPVLYQGRSTLGAAKAGRLVLHQDIYLASPGFLEPIAAGIRALGIRSFDRDHLADFYHALEKRTDEAFDTARQTAHLLQQSEQELFFFVQRQPTSLRDFAEVAGIHKATPEEETTFIEVERAADSARVLIGRASGAYAGRERYPISVRFIAASEQLLDGVRLSIGNAS